MKPPFRAAALLIAIGLVSGCNGPRRFERQAGAVRMPTAPVLEPSPDDAISDPDKVGTVGAPQPRSDGGIPRTPTLSGFDN